MNQSHTPLQAYPQVPDDHERRLVNTCSCLRFAIDNEHWERASMLADAILEMKGYVRPHQ